MRRLLLAALLLCACRRTPPPPPPGTLHFLRDGQELRALGTAELTQKIPPETFSAFDPYYQRQKTWRALPLRAVLELGFAGLPADQDILMRATDGYTVPSRVALLAQDGAYLAFADADAPGWESIGPQRANPGPYYVVWRQPHQQNIEAYPRPWQLSALELVRFEKVFPHVAPSGAAEPAQRGFAIFSAQCLRCHAINREGGHVGPDLNVPQSIVEYRPAEQIRAYIKNPLTFRYSTMPPHPQLGDDDLDALLAYFTAMKTRKHDPR